MPRQSPLATPEPWDLVAEGYVAENLTYFESFAREALRLVPAKGDVLDVAAGPGSLSLQAARTARRVGAVDFSRRMLLALRARAAAASVENVDLRLADGQALPFLDGQFDSAYSMFGLIFFPDVARGLRELVRVLRPGGTAVVTSWPPFERIPMLQAIFAAMKAELPNAGIGEAPSVLGSGQEIEGALSSAGFQSVGVHECTVEVGTATPAAVWASFSRGGAPAVLLRRKMGDQAFAALSGNIVNRLERALGTEPLAYQLTALFGVGTTSPR